jgi:hypothetical protein
MPARKQATTATPKLHRRTVRHLGCSYTSRVPGPDGTVRETLVAAIRGEEILLTATEAARLDTLGALAAEGETTEDVLREVDAKIEAYREARRGAGLEVA